MLTFKNIFLAVSFLAAVIFAYLYFTKKCPAYDTTNNALIDSLNRFISYRQKDSSTIIEQNQYILKQKQAIDAGILENKQLKTYVAQVKFRTKESRSVTVVTKEQVPPRTTRAAEYYDSARAAFLDSLMDKYPFLKVPEGYALVDTNQFHRVPRSVEFEDKWLTLRGTDNKDSLQLALISTRNNYTVTIGSKKMGFFKARKPVVLLDLESPYSEAVDMGNVVIKFKEPFYKRPWFIATATAAVIEGIRFSLKRK